MAANLLEMGSKLLIKAIVEENIQWSTEMAHPIHLYHATQLDLPFRRIIRKVVETGLRNRIQWTQTEISYPPRRVGTYVRRE